MEYIKFDPTDLKGMRRLMKEHGDSETAKLGSNENGEDVAISIFKDRIVVVTYQSNGWIRKNIYYPDGSREELFDGRYKK